MNTIDAIKSRRSIRKYKPDAVIPDGDIEEMLTAAMMAPSACNTRPWEFVVVKDAAVRAKITEIYPYTRMISSASAAIVVCGRPDLQSGVCGEFWPEDCGAAVENILLSALELGYGTCWCGLWPAPAEKNSALAALLGVTSTPLACVAVGVADENPAARGYYDPDRVRVI